jgi:hypothetical protein
MRLGDGGDREPLGLGQLDVPVDIALRVDNQGLAGVVSSPPRRA